MKFETPIAEIELFELRDIISTSGGSEEPTETTDDTTDYDRLIDRQLERAAITCTAGFAKIFTGASKKLSY